MQSLLKFICSLYRSLAADSTVSLSLWRNPHIAGEPSDAPNGNGDTTETGLFCSRLSRSSASSASIIIGEEQPVPYGCIHHAILAHAAHGPFSVAAIAHCGAQITYGDLAEESLHLAWNLHIHGVGKGSRVCLVIQRSIPSIIAILAILRLGAAYIPLDSDSVTNMSLQTILADVQPAFTLISRACIHRAAHIDSPHGCLEDILESRDYIQSTLPQVLSDVTDPSDCAYIIFTSGTTGIPKGVKVCHRSVTNLLCLSPGNLNIAPGTHVAQLLNIAFDMCVWETLGCLMNGGTLHLRGPRREHWLQVLRTVNVVICTPSILAEHDPIDYPNIRVVATAGEPCPITLADKWARCVVFYNSCGPTEVTIVNTMHRHYPGIPITIGKPTPNNTVYVLDESLLPVPRGVAGVMWAGGLCVSQGYLNRADLTQSKFISDPFGKCGTFMYNTGDMVKLREDGELDHLGRSDDQVKIKGFRVELDGVSAAMQTCPGVKHACSLLIEGKLWGFFSPESVLPEDVKAATCLVQPRYAVPTMLQALNSMPLTCNGKIDKKALKNMVLHTECNKSSL